MGARRVALVGLVVAGFLVAPSVSPAATVSYSGEHLVFTAGNGEVNTAHCCTGAFTASTSDFNVRDLGDTALTPGAQCTSPDAINDPGLANCTGGVGPVDQTWTLGDLNDEYVGNLGFGSSITADLGPGDDTGIQIQPAQSLELTGGPGDDTLNMYATYGQREVLCGPGDDTASTRTNGPGPFPHFSGCERVACYKNENGTPPNSDDPTKPNGCPKVARKLTLARKSGRFRGRLSADRTACESGQRVDLYRRHGGTRKRVGSDETDGSGHYSITAPKRAGTYVAVAPIRMTPDTPLDCTPATSNPI